MRKRAVQRIVIDNDNYKNLIHIMQAFREKKVKEVCLVYGEGRDVPPVSLVAPYIKKAKDYAKEHGIHILPNNYVFKRDIELDYSAAKCVYENKKSNTEKKASIIILTHNRRDYLFKVLESLKAQKNIMPEEFEVIIVDDGSTDKTLDALKTKNHAFRLSYIFWPRKKNEIFGRNRAGPARNIGAKHAKGKFLIFIDGDIVLSPEFVSEHLKSHASGNRCVVIGPSIRERERIDVREKYFMLCDDSIEKLPVPWAMLHSGNFSVEKESFEKQGGFSPDFVYWGMEDDELGFRFFKSRVKIVLNRKAYGTHLWHPPEYIDDEKKEYGDKKNAELFYKKHLDFEIYNYHLTRLSKDVKPGYLSIKLSDKCNNNCDFCDFLGQRRKHLSSMGEIIDTIKYAKENNKRIVISGGEPTLSRDFFKVLPLLEDVNSELLTNARAFSYMSFARKTTMFVKNFLVCVFGPEEDIHDSITKVKGSFIQTMKGIDNLILLGCNVAVHIVINGANYSYFEKTVLMLKKKGITDFHLSVVPPGVDSSDFSQDDFSGFVKHALGLDIKLRNDFFTCLKTKQQGKMNTMDMKKCLHCYFVDECRGRPGKLDKKTVFFRDDDVAELTPTLKRLIELFMKHKVPLVLAVVPKKVTKETVQYLKNMKARHHGLLELTQHGFSHENNSKTSVPYEFGRALSYNEQFEKISKGKKIMNELFGNDFTHVFVPPYNSFDKNTIKALKKLDFKGLSVDFPVTELYDLSTNIDIVKSYHPLVFYSEKEILKKYQSKKYAGFLVHHEMLEDSHFKVLEKLITDVQDETILNFSQLKNPRILLVQPKFPQDSALVCEPTGLLSLAGYLRQKHEVKILDMNLSSDHEKIIDDFAPKYIGFSAVTPQILNAYKLSKQIKQKNPDTIIIFGGVHPTFMPDEAIEQGLADYVVVGEGEKTMQNLIDTLEDGNLPENVNGIAIKRSNKIIHTKENEFICDLDKLPFPAYDLVPIGLYRTSECMIPGKQKKAVHLLTSRGCPNNCSYCASPKLYKRRVRFRSIENVISELKELKNIGIEWVHFHDDNFLISKTRVEELCTKIIENKLEFSWTCLANVKTVAKHPEILSVMKNAGCIGVEIGIETGDTDVFQKIGKDQDIDIIKKAAREIKKAGLYAEYLMIAYNIGETIDSPFLSMKLLYEINFGNDEPKTKNKLDKIPDFDTKKIVLMGHLARASPGSLFYTQAKKQGMLLTKTWNDHFEENIGFIPNSFLDDNIKILKKVNNVLQYIKSHEKQLRFYVDNCFYTSNYVLREFESLDDFFVLMEKIYMEYCNKTVREVIDELGSPKIVVSAVSMLSLLRLVGNPKF